MTTAKILLVEDERIVALNLQKQLVSDGYEVVGVSETGEQAIAQAGDRGPDLVLMDIRLKGEMDGIAAAQAIRARYQLPIIYMTAYADDETLARAKPTEPFGYLVKPVREEQMRAAIEMSLHQQQIERKLRQSQQLYLATLTCVGDGVIAMNRARTITFINPVAERLTGWPSADALGRPLSIVFQIADSRKPGGPEALMDRPASSRRSEGLLTNRHGRPLPIEYGINLIQDAAEKPIGAVLAFRDISERKQAQQAMARLNEELALRVEELQATLEHVKQLQGLLPMCAWCKRIRDDQNYWQALEEYFSAHGQIQFTHSICPDCLKSTVGQDPGVSRGG